jgi:hypothetical protein
MLEFILFWVIFMAILAWVGYRLQSGMQAEIKQRQLAREWPRVGGQVIEAHVAEQKSTLISGGLASPLRIIRLQLFKPVITYTYAVGGKSFQASRYRNNYLTRSGEWQTLLPKKAAEIVAGHPQGKAVTVTYNPADPTQAYLAVETSQTGPLTRRCAGLLIMAGAVLLFARGAYVLVGDLTSRAAVSSAPAVIPVSTDAIKTGVASSLGLPCSKYTKTNGVEMRYKAWDCENEPADGLGYIRIFSREKAEDKVDAVHALIGATDPQGETRFFTAVALLAVPSANRQEVQDWLAQAGPALTQAGNSVETAFGGVKFTLSNPYGMGRQIQIGELQ